MSFDAKQFLQDYEIDAHSSGKNTTRGWVQIQCPFDDCADNSDHLGINIKTGIWHCWICGRKGPIPLLISKLLKINIRKAEEVAQRYESLPTIADEKPQVHPESIKIKGLLSHLPDPHLQYLKDRNFNPEEIIEKYHIGAFGTIGRFPYRLAIPVFDDYQFVNMTARDITGKQEQRYLSLRNDESVLSLKDCVYNIDNCFRDSILIVEGPFDVWRMGGATVSFFGTTFKTTQILKVLSKFPKNIFILFDKGADKHASSLAYHFSPFVKHVEILNIDEKDPADMDPKTASEIAREIGIK